MKQWLKEFVHNCVVHPMMPFLPTGLANALHEVNGYWAFGKPFIVSGEEVKLTTGGRLTSEELKQWQAFYGLTHYENKTNSVKVPEGSVLLGRELLAMIDKAKANKPNSEIRKLAQALLDDAMDGGPLKALLKNQSRD